VSVVLRFSAYEVEELDELIQSNWGHFPRSSVLNSALEYFLQTHSTTDLKACEKRKVNFLIGRKRLERLDQCALSHHVNRADLIRFTIHKIIPLFAEGKIVESF
jgi:hypothetical protein